jgi:serine/threonine protein kinase
MIERRIGRGATGDVYLARHEMLDTLYAIKVLTASETVMAGETARRFVREAKIAARIQHSNLVRVHDAGYDEVKNVYYSVMDYMGGGTLRDKIAFGGPIPALEDVNRPFFFHHVHKRNRAGTPARSVVIVFSRGRPAYNPDA